jgi:hypothetical protein
MLSVFYNYFSGMTDPFAILAGPRDHAITIGDTYITYIDYIWTGDCNFSVNEYWGDVELGTQNETLSQRIATAGVPVIFDTSGWVIDANHTFSIAWDSCSDLNLLISTEAGITANAFYR